MFESNRMTPRRDRRLFARPRRNGTQERLMIGALVLLLAALSAVLYIDRDFWFPDTPEADDQLQPPGPAIAPETSAAAKVRTPHKTAGQKSRRSTAPADDPAPDLPFAVVAQRTVLPPLEVEVVAGDVRRAIRTDNNSVRVDLQSGSAPQPPADPPPPAPSEEKPGITEAAERVQMSPDIEEVVSHSVKPDYPLLARQMKVQGSVILQAVIGKDGLIEDLHVISGPPILAAAAQEAVRQWHFKPHYQGAYVVETQTRITVNFTISTN